MTIEELENTLPNGFHDSYLLSVAVDFAAGTGCIELDVDYDDPDPNVFRRMKLRLKGLSLFIVEPPDLRSSLSAGRICTSGDVTSEKVLSGLESYRKNVPTGSFFYTFFLDHLNCFIHLAAQEAELEQT
jgi:hypothetical protein